jgi:Fe-S cluster assembly ATPase SufC
MNSGRIIYKNVDVTNHNPNKRYQIGILTDRIPFRLIDRFKYPVKTKRYSTSHKLSENIYEDLYMKANFYRKNKLELSDIASLINQLGREFIGFQLHPKLNYSDLTGGQILRIKLLEYLTNPSTIIAVDAPISYNHSLIPFVPFFKKFGEENSKVFLFTDDRGFIDPKAATASYKITDGKLVEFEDNKIEQIYLEDRESFDIFIAHNSKDKKEIKQVCNLLSQNGINCWVDYKNIFVGEIFQEAIHYGIDDSKSAGIFIGKSGLGKWQKLELSALISQCVNKGIPVIPILLPGVTEVPNEFLFLKEFNYVKLESINVDALDSIIRAIKKVKSSA